MSILDEYDIKRDERFKRARKEAKIIFVYMGLMAVYILGVAYWGSKVSVKEYTYLFGMPTHMFLMFGGAFVFMFIGCVIALYVIKDVSLEEKQQVRANSEKIEQVNKDEKKVTP